MMLTCCYNKNKSKQKNPQKTQTIQEIIKASFAKKALLMKGEMRTLRKKNKKVSSEILKTFLGSLSLCMIK